MPGGGSRPSQTLLAPGPPTRGQAWPPWQGTVQRPRLHHREVTKVPVRKPEGRKGGVRWPGVMAGCAVISEEVGF